MFSYEIDYLVSKERHKDRLRALERQRLIQPAGLQQPGYGAWAGKAADWIWTQLVAWRSKMPRHNPVHHQVLSRRR